MSMMRAKENWPRAVRTYAPSNVRWAALTSTSLFLLVEVSCNPESLTLVLLAQLNELCEGADGIDHQDEAMLNISSQCLCWESFGRLAMDSYEPGTWRGRRA